MNITKKMIVILLAFSIITSVFIVMPEEVFADNFDLEAFDNDVESAKSMKELANNTAITAISVARVVCVAIAIVILLVIAMKYMMSAPGDRADIKKYAIHYVIGAFILFGVTGILGIINNFALQIK